LEQETTHLVVGLLRVACSSSCFLKERIEEEDEEDGGEGSQGGEGEGWRSGEEAINTTRAEGDARTNGAVAGTGIGIVHVLRPVTLVAGSFPPPGQLGWACLSLIHEGLFTPHANSKYFLFSISHIESLDKFKMSR
jgi:hypothetical protein